MTTVRIHPVVLIHTHSEFAWPDETVTIPRSGWSWTAGHVMPVAVGAHRPFAWSILSLTVCHLYVCIQNNK